MKGVIALLFVATCHFAHAEHNTPPHEIHCEGENDGLHEIGCWGYADCKDGKPEVHACDAGLVFERDTMSCITPGTGNSDCFIATECVGKADGSYPDYGDNCQTYYRCAGELVLGRLYCPGGTHFNEKLQICDYPQNLFSPCGTKVNPNPPTTTTTTTTTPAPTTTTTPAPTTTTTTTTAVPTTTAQQVSTHQIPIVVG